MQNQLTVQFFADASTPEDDGPERTYTQEDIDRVVEDRLARERRKYKGFEHYKRIADILRENGSIEGETPEEIAAAVEDFYNTSDREETEEVKPEDDAPRHTLSEKQRKTLAKAEANEFAERAAMPELLGIYVALQKKGKRRTDEEDLWYETISQKVWHSRTADWGKRNIAEFKKKYPLINLDELLSDEDFVAITRGWRDTLIAAYELYRRLAGKKAKEPMPSTGSVRDRGGLNDGEYLSKEQVEKMSREQVRRHYDKIKKSMTRW